MTDDAYTERAREQLRKAETKAVKRAKQNGRGNGQANGHAGDDTHPDPKIFTVKYWIERELPPPDFLLGELFSTTSRVLLAAPTGCGKTGIAMAFGYNMANGHDFLHWRCRRAARNVVLIDGEMSGRVAKDRLCQAVKRHGKPPENFFYINRDDYPSMPPLDTEQGQQFVDWTCERIGNVEQLILDNMQALFEGNLRDEEPWGQTLPWSRSLTRRAIGQAWLHHTGPKGVYGNKAVEWQMDTVGIMTDLRDTQQADGPLTDFRLEFPKARERNFANRSDFAPAHIWIEDDQWHSSIEPANAARGESKLSNRDKAALEYLYDALARASELPLGRLALGKHIPSGTPAITVAALRDTLKHRGLYDGALSRSRTWFYDAKTKLIAAGKIGIDGDYVWAIGK